jgi:dihydroorotate dehydrogenase
MLKQEILDTKFKNPVGLAAGFDKNAKLMNILPSVGFGHEEIGSVTGEPCAGNTKPRLWRLPKSRAIVVYYGLMNDGCEVIVKKLKGRKFKFPVGVSIAKTNSPDTVECDSGIADYVKAYKEFTEAEVGDFYTINISCPNAYGGEPFTDSVKLDLLLAAITELPKRKPIFIKLAADLTHEQTDKTIEVARKYKIDGFVASNLTKNRDNLKIIEKEVPEQGGISGKAVEHLSDELIKYLYKQTQGEFIIIGCGGVFTAEDAYKKIRLGASMIQLITGMIYEGPQTIGAINQGLVKLLKSDGFKNISEAIGVDIK